MWLPKIVQDFVTLSLSILIEALPFVLLGIGISMAVHVWLPSEQLLNNLPKNPLLRRAMISLLGVCMPVCECGNVPLARGLMKKGLTPAESLVFLLAAPILNPITIITTQQAFGGDPVVIGARVIGGFVIANSVGWVYSRTKRSDIIQPEFVAYCQEDDRSVARPLKRALMLFRQESRALLPALLFGAVVAGLLQVMVSREVLLALGSNPVWSVFAMLALAFVVSICSSVDAFFALAFRNVFTVGSLVSFLLFGPMIDIKMLSLMRTTFKMKILIQITGLTAVMAALIGLVVNYAL